MKKIYSFMMIAVMALVMSFAAKAATVTLNVDDPSRVNVMVNWEEKDLVAGDNTFQLETGRSTTIYIGPMRGAIIKSVVNAAGVPESTWDGTYYIYEYPSDEDYASKYTITSASLADSRTASCTVNVDKAANIGSLSFESTYDEVTLVDGANIVKFMPGVESPFTLSTPYGVTYYKVTVDGVEVSENWGSYYLYVEDGSVVDILTEYPDVDVTVNLSFSSDEAKGLVQGVTANGTEVTPDAEGNITVKMGAEITLLMDVDNYAVNEFAINGTTPSNWYGATPEYSFVVKENTNVYIDAHKYGVFNITIKIDNPSCALVTNYFGETIDLTSGEATIQMNENSAAIKVTKAAGCKISSILMNGEEYSEYGYDSSYGTQVYIYSDNTVIEIKASEIVYDNKAIVYIDDNCYSYSYITNQATRDQVYLVKGENKVGFNNGNNSFYMNVMTTNYNAPAAIYLNGVFATNYSGSNWTLANGDYITVCMNERPAETAVSFTMATSASDIKVATNGQECSNWADGLTVMDGTEITVSGIQVIVNGNIVEAQADGSYKFVATGAETTVVLCDDATGIEEIATDAAAVEYYNLQGVKVANPEKGIFVRKQAGKAVKVVL